MRLSERGMVIGYCNYQKQGFKTFVGVMMLPNNKSKTSLARSFIFPRRLLIARPPVYEEKY